MVNIISIYMKVLNLLAEEKKAHIKNLEYIKNNYSDMKDIIDTLEDNISNVSNETNIFILNTYNSVINYTKILEQPIYSSDFENIEEKNKNAILFHKKVISLIEKKDWDKNIIYNNFNIYNTLNNNNNKIYCQYCLDYNDLFFDDEYNRKICLKCSYQQTYSTTKLTCKDYIRINMSNRFTYDRSSHFRDCIKQYQGKQNCKIDKKILEDLDKKFKSNRLLILNTESNVIRYNKITRNYILIFLKELKYTKHYENVNYIYKLLTDKYIDDISHLEDILINQYKDLLSLYDNIYGKGQPNQLDRKNFMNSQYLLYQLLRNNNHPCDINNFNMLKTNVRKIFHDNICKNLFNKLGWKFTPTF